MTNTTDPWRLAGELLAQKPPRMQVGSNWRPGDTQNPRHSRAPYFSPLEAVEFVRRALKELLKHRAKHGSGTPSGITARDETFFKDPSKRAYILVIEGSATVPPVYVKWVFSPSDARRDLVHFISFHASNMSSLP